MTTPLTATAAATTTTSAGSSEPVPTNPNSELGQDAFLKLMVAQLQAQNPLEPSNSNEFIGELAQFTEVEQMTNLSDSGQLSGAVQLIGHTVTYDDSSGQSSTGTVQSVQSTASGTTVTVSGVAGIALSNITEVT